MTTQPEKAAQFAALHVKGDPVVIYNVWDAASAKAVVEAGAKVIGTGSHSVAGAQGYDDAEAIPLDFVERIISRITASVDCPVTVDFEGGYARGGEELAANVARIMDAGAVGINFEDQIIGGEGVYSIEEQCARIALIRAMADKKGVPLFINARIDLFIKNRDKPHAPLIDEAKTRAKAYAEAGASGVFAPLLIDEALIADLCEASPVPVNIMMLPGAPSIARLGELGVARVSYGPGPFIAAMNSVTKRAREALAGS